MKNLFVILLMAFCVTNFSLSEETSFSYKELFDEMGKCRTQNAPPLTFQFKYRNGFLKTNTGVEIECKIDTANEKKETVKIIAINSFFVLRKILFREKEINIYRFFSTNSGFINGKFGMDYDTNYSFDNKTTLHLYGFEGFASFNSLSDFKRFLVFDNEYFNHSKLRFIEYYNKDYIEADANLVEDKDYNVIHLRISLTKFMLNWENPITLPPSPFKPNFKIIEPF